MDLKLKNAARVLLALTLALGDSVAVGSAASRLKGQPRGQVSVKSTIGGKCPAALGNGSTNDASAIQCHLDYLYKNFDGGVAYFPPGNYVVDGGLTVNGGVQLNGNDQTTTVLEVLSDSPVVYFNAASCQRGASMNNMTVLGYQDPSVHNNAVTIGDNCPVNLSDDTIWFGNAGLYDTGVDGQIQNSFIWGYQYSVLSQGANWYIRVKMDTTGSPSGTAFYQGLPVPEVANVAENHFEECDFSGDYQYSVQIQDPTGAAASFFDDSVFSSPIAINGSRVTTFNDAELGAEFFVNSNAGTVTISNSIAYGPLTVVSDGSNVLDGGGNTGISFAAETASIAAPSPLPSSSPIPLAGSSASCTPTGVCSNSCGQGMDNCGNICVDNSGCAQPANDSGGS